MTKTHDELWGLVNEDGDWAVCEPDNEGKLEAFEVYDTFGDACIAAGYWFLEDGTRYTPTRIVTGGDE